MSTKIEWTDETWNPVTGCTNVSQGCKNCYAERLWPKVEGARVKREGGAPRPFTELRFHPNRLGSPIAWEKPRRVFVNSMSDLFHDDVHTDWIDQIFAVMAMAMQHTFQVLTKRPERMFKYTSDPAMAIRVINLMQGYGWPGKDPFLPNVLLGVSVEDQATADERIPLLRQTPAAVRFISYEPALGPVNFGRPRLSTDMSQPGQSFGRIHWIIAGGESGPHARPAHPDWFRSARDQCAAAGVPFFFKQWGQWLPGSQYTEALAAIDTDDVYSRFDSKRWNGEAFYDYDPLDPAPGEEIYSVGKKAAGRILDGRTHDGYPA